MAKYKIHVVETCTYEFVLDTDEHEVPEEVDIDSANSVFDWLNNDFDDNDIVVEECVDSNYAGCQDRQIEQVVPVAD
ncbi:hypothetical protein [Acrocarpospora sp. B8E8]|uniref:hypothetical protein n=1 Tax=Acrocarpospora sp. B8E8 TaxID=3153572 RepID=UPI00325E04E9